MQLTGRLLQTTGVEQINDTFKKTNLIIETDYDTQYPQEISIEVHNDNIDKLKSCGAKAGDLVTVDLNLRGRGYEKAGQPKRWFNTLVLWKIAKSGDAPAATPPPVQVLPADEDPLPF